MRFHRILLFSISISLLCAWGYQRGTFQGPYNSERENARAASAEDHESPIIEAILVNGQTVWSKGQDAPAQVNAGDWVQIIGSGFGSGPDIDYSKILVGKIRALERDINTYEGDVHLVKHLFYEKDKIVDTWPSDIRSWTPTTIEFRIPEIAHEGPLVISKQKRVGWLPSLVNPSLPFLAIDPLTERVEGGFIPATDVVSMLGPIQQSNAVPLVVNNPQYAELVAQGERIFWGYDFNLSLVHHIEGLDWNTILQGKAIDPTTGQPGDPQKLFGAIPLVADEVPAVATQKLDFSPFPSQKPLKPIVGQPLTSGATWPTNYVGHVWTEGSMPVTGKKRRLDRNWLRRLP